MSSKTEGALRTVIGRLNIKQAVHAAAVRKAQRKVLREALNWAYTVSARDYFSKWASYLLDPEFQALTAGPFQECYLKGVACLNPTELAGCWADQLGDRWIGQRHMDELVVVASRFLRSLEAELCRNAQFQGKLDCSTA